MVGDPRHEVSLIGICAQWVRFRVAIESFRQIHGDWPEGVSLSPSVLNWLQRDVPGHVWRRVIQRLNICVSASECDIVAFGAGRFFRYGFDANPAQRSEPQFLEWLGFHG